MSARITVDPSAVVRNWSSLSARTGSECAAVVKANAYGLGVDVVIPPLVAAGCRTFFVALVEEGLAVRRLAPDATIYVLNGVFGDPRPAVEAALRPFLSSPRALGEWGATAPFALNVDTGMNRLGVTPEEALTLSAEGIRPALVASHFACADTPDHPLNVVQEERFAAVSRAFPHVQASLANSAALLTRAGAHYDLTRPGIALYGGRAAEGVPPLEPAAKLESRVIQVREALEGEAVGYGAAERLRRPARLAVASLGYADGYLRAAGGSNAKPGAPAFVNGYTVRLCGRVSMDLVTIDVTDAPCERGDPIEFFGPNVPLDAAAAAAGTIGYELLTGLSGRAERVVGAL